MGTNRPTEPPARIVGAGTHTPPAGITPVEAERLAREADAQREREHERA
jgi:hypothetical protein